jgi:hypothetical protein
MRDHVDKLEFLLLAACVLALLNAVLPAVPTHLGLIP